MNIIKQFTSKNLKLNRKRTIVTIIGIMLSTALICAVAGMVTSLKQTMIAVYKDYDGDYYASFQDIPQDQLKYIENNENVQSYFITENVGYAKLENSQNSDKPYLFIMNFDSSALKRSGVNLTSGRMSENSNEILIEESLYSNGGVNLKVGDTVTYDIGNRVTSDGTILNQSNPYCTGGSTGGYAVSDLEDELVDTSKTALTENLNTTKTKTYTIVGTIKRVSSYIEPYSAAGYTCISYLENNSKVENANVQVTYKSAKDYKDKTSKILNVIQNNTGNKYEIKYNADLAKIEGGVSDEIMTTLYILAAIVISIILVSSVFVIRNSFSISVSEKIKQYGMLSSIGATSKQIKKSVLYEGAYVGTWGIVLGILLGTLAVKILCEVMNIILVDSLGETMKFVYSVPFTAILVAIVISTITIYLSCIIPAKKAARISPIDAIRGKDDIKLNAKKLKTTRLFKKVLGIGGTIAKKNLKRSRKKYRTTVVSLVVSISIFISLFTFIDYGNKISNMQYSGMKYNLSIYEGTEEAYNEYKKLDNIQDYIYQCNDSATINYKKFGTDFLKNVISESGKNEETPSTITFINSEYFKKYVKLLGLNENDYKNITILNNISMEYNSKDKKAIRNRLFNIKDGDILSAALSTNKEETDIKITKVINEDNNNLPLGNESIYYGTRGQIFASLDSDLTREIKNLDKSRGVIYIKSSNAAVTQKEIESIDKEKNLTGNSIENSEELEKQMQSLLLVVSIFLYGFIIVISLIGVTNIFNTITTNMILRSKEFAMLKSIGMTSKEFNRMIRLESLMYGLKSLAIRIPIGLLGSYGIYKAISSRMELGYMVPWSAIIISIIFVFVIVSLTLKYSLNKINKQNIIDTIRNDNM